MVDKIDPSNLTSVEYGSQLLQQKQKQEAEYYDKIRKDNKVENWLGVLGGIDTIIKNRATRNVNDRIQSSDSDLIREKAEIKAYNDEYAAQKNWREAEEGMGIDQFAQTEADAFLRTGKYSNVADKLALLQTHGDDLYAKFVADRDLVAKYKTQQYKANKISKPIQEEEYLKNLMGWRRGPKDAGLIHETAKIFGRGKDKAEMALEDLLDPNGQKYSEELIANKAGLEKLLTAKNEKGELVWNNVEQERLREAMVGVATVAAPRVRDEVESSKNTYNPFGTPTTSRILTVTENTPDGKRVKEIYTNNDGQYQDIVNGVVVPKTKAEIAKASNLVLANISANLAENNKTISKENIFKIFREENYDLYAKAYATNAIEFPKGYVVPTLSNDDKLNADATIRSLTDSNIISLTDSKQGEFLKDFKEVFLDPEELDLNQGILYDNFTNGVAESTKYYMGTGLERGAAQNAAYREQLEGWEQIGTTRSGLFGSNKVYNFKRQAAGSLVKDRQTGDDTSTTTTTSSITDNSQVPASDGGPEVFTTGTEETRAQIATNLTANPNLMSTYSTSNFATKNKMLDAAARRDPNKVRVSMEDFVEVGESVRLEGNKGYIIWNGSQFEQSGVAAVFGAIESGKQKQMTFDDVPEGSMKDLIREKAVTMYATYASNVDEDVDISDPDKLFKGSFAQDYGLIPSIANKWLGGGTSEQQGRRRNQPKLRGVDSLVDIAGYSFFGITQGDSALARDFLIDAMIDAMPTEEDRLIAAGRTTLNQEIV